MVDQLTDLLADKRLYLNSAPLDAYPSSVRPNLPALESLPKEKRDTPAWLPLHLRLIPPPAGSKRLSRIARVRMGKA